MKRVALVTGANGGIGSAIVDGLQEDFTVVGWTRESQEACVPHVVVVAAGSRQRPLRDNWAHSVRVTERFLPLMRIIGWGRVILFAGGGVGGEKTDLEDPHYCASKAAVTIYAECLGRTAPKGITVNVIAPGKIATKMTNYEGDTPKRLVQLVKWLCTDEASHVSGRLLSARWDDIESLQHLNKYDNNKYRLRRVVE